MSEVKLYEVTIVYEYGKKSIYHVLETNETKAMNRTLEKDGSNYVKSVEITNIHLCGYTKCVSMDKK